MKAPFVKAFEVAKRYRAELVTGGARPSLFSKASETTGKLYIYEQIGADWWTGEGVTAKAVAAALDAMKGVKTLDVYINSPGGDVFEGKAIYANLQRFDSAEKVMHVDGLAASAASFIAMAGDKILTAEQGTWMVHQAWGGAVGRADDMRAMADVLDMLNNDLAGIYAKRTGASVDEMLEVMAAETWMTAAEALEMKFTDALEQADDGDTEPAALADAPRLVATAALTQQRLNGMGAAARMRARAEMNQRNHPAQTGAQRLPAGR